MTDYSASGHYTREFIGGALITLLWTCSQDDSDKPLLDKYGSEDIAPQSRQAFEEECKAFLDLVEEECEGDVFVDISPDTFGHNFVLSKNRHGAGLWDMGLGDLGDELHKLATTFGESFAYEAVDGRIHIA
jgi:hypothetical protein